MRLSIFLSILCLHLILVISGQIITQTGQTSISTIGTGGTATQTISFSQAFPTSPSVCIAITGFQQTGGGPVDMSTAVSAITTTGFIATITWNTNYPLTVVQISYIASTLR